MNFVPKEIYHYTKRENLEKIFNDRYIKHGLDMTCCVSGSLSDVFTVMGNTIMREGAAYYGVDGIKLYYPKFIPLDYVIIKSTGRYSKWDKWYWWFDNGDVGLEVVMKKMKITYEKMKMFYMGNLRLDKIEVLEVVDYIQDYCYQNSGGQWCLIGKLNPLSPESLSLEERAEYEKEGGFIL